MKKLAYVLLLCVFLGSCYMQKVAYMVKKDTVVSFYVVDTSFDVAFSKALETALEKGLTVGASDKAGGTFGAVYPGTAFGGTVTTMSFLLTRESDTKLKCTISLKSSKSNQSVIDDFKAAYAKKVKISEN